MRFGMLFFVLFAPAALYAGEVFGSVREGNNSVANVDIEIQCGKDIYPKRQTDQYGTYSIYVARPGACTLKIYYKGQTPEIEIQSYGDPQRYDFLLVREGNRYVLRRT
jgi:hypothetical protein